MRIGIFDKSLNEKVGSDDPDYVIRKIRESYLAESAVTINLIGSKSGETFGYAEQEYTKREQQEPLYSGGEHTKSGILGFGLPSMYQIFKDKYHN